MKKIYITPSTFTVRIELGNRILITSTMDVVNEGEPIEASKGGWVKENRSDYNVWDDDWSR